MDTAELVQYEKEGQLAWLTLNRPRALNAVNLAMRDQLWTALQAVRDDPDVRVVALRGAGERAFCAGADITEFGSAPSYLAARQARQLRDLWGAMLALEKPLVAAIHGWALGAGCELSLLCDFRIASEDAKFGLPEVQLGYIPSAGGTQTLPRHVPLGIALGMIATGEPIEASCALQLGLVHAVVPRAQLPEQTRALAERLIARPPHAIQLAREALAGARDLPLSAGLAVAARLAARALHDPARPAAALTQLAAWAPAHG